jgi:hypothetical protein
METLLHPDPTNVALARTFGFILLAIGVLSLVSGKTYNKSFNPFGLTYKSENLRGYWISVVCFSLLGLFLVVMGYVSK